MPVDPQLVGFDEVKADRVRGQLLAVDGQDLDVGGLGGTAGVRDDPNGDLARRSVKLSIFPHDA